MNPTDNQPRVLVVDDDDHIRRVLGFILEKEFDVRTVESGNSAVELIRSDTDFDVVSLDLNMPGMSGIETLKAVKELSPTTEVLLVTAYSDLESAKQALKFGAYEYIEKPINKAIYRKAVQRGLKRRRKSLESQKAQEQLEIVRAQLVHSEKFSAIGELIAGVVHEINNPLASILGYTELLLQGKTSPEKRHKFLENIYQSGMLCKRVVQTLLTFSRKQEIKKKHIQLRDIIESTLELVQHEIKVKNIHLIKQLPEEFPKIFADFYQVQQVFLNIINNAIQAMAQQARTPTLTIKSEHDDSTIRISIIDNGPGIPKANIQKIFEPFFTTKPEGKGTGLGLSICLEIIQHHGGDIYISSEPGKGSNFVIEIPVAVRQESQPVEHPVGETDRTTAQHILVIENDETGSDLLENMISSLGHRADVARDAAEAQQKLENGDHQVIISNISMQDFDGRYLFGHLQRISPERCSRVILVTGGALSEETKRFLKENRIPHISKPFELQDIQEAIQKAMQASS
ncbi:response regulator [Thermodesulfobacteriota bacterium]